jgi:hypothetical protein
VAARGIRITFARRPDCWTGVLQWRVNGTPDQPINISIDSRLIIEFDTFGGGGLFDPGFSLTATQSMNVYLFAAAYDAEGRLIRTNIQSAHLSPGVKQMLRTSVPTADGSTYKFFIWDSEYIPLTSITSIDDL